jgi:diaminopimelate decarboxylase
VREILRDASRLTHARLVGAHFYPSTNAASEDDLLADLEATVSTAAGLAREGLTMRLLDVGGGFAAPYARPGRRPHYSRLRDGLAKLLDRYFPGWTAGRPQVAVESGRYLVADCGTLVTQVLDLKTSHGRRFAVVDAGINQLGGMSALRRVLPMAAYPDQAIDDAQQPAIDLAGPLCTPGDVLGRNVVLPPGMAIGDLLTVPNVGAYGLTASLIAFLGHPVAAEIVVDGEQIVSASRLESRRVAVPTEY